MSRFSTDGGAAIIIPPVSGEPPAVHPEVGTVNEKSAAIIDPEVAVAPSTNGEVWDEEEYPLPTDDERKTLRKVPDTIPSIAYILCVAELAERASYYATTGVFNNFMEYPLPKGGNGAGAPAKDDVNGHAGALNKGLQFASALVLLFTFLAYVFPILGAWIADTKLGRYKTILWGVGLGAVAHVIMVGGSAPSVLKAGNGEAPFLISFVMLAIGAGIFKPNVAPTVLDQYTHQREYVKTLKSGERVLVDPETTIQRIMSTYAERYVGYWLAYLLPTIMYCLVIVVFLSVKKRIIKKPPMGSELSKFFKITLICCKENKFMVWKKGFWDAARPATLAEKGKTAGWNNRLVTDVGRAWSACQIFLYIPIYNLNDGGIGAATTNLAGSMTLNGAPNDLLNNFNALTIIFFTPVFAFIIYPLLQHFGIRFGSIKRMTVGMTIAAISGVCGGIAQLYVYRTSPCGYQASTCDTVSPISVWWELPMIMLGAISELLVNVTSYEMAYSRAPASMKSVIFSICLLMSALSAAAGEVLTPVIQDPYLTWVWFGPAIVLFAQTAVFWIRHHKMDDEAYITHDAESDVEDETVAGENSKSSDMEAEKGAPIYEKS